MTATEALNILNVRPQTLYANVSRGKIRAKADEADPRRSLYHRDDILRMARRANGRRKIDAVSAQAMQWGDPVLPSSISTAAADGKLLYRGQDAAMLANSATLEDIAVLLWQCAPSTIHSARPANAATMAARRASANATAEPGALAIGLLTLATLAGNAPPSLARSPEDLHADAAAILSTLTAAITGPLPDSTAGLTISARLAHAWHCPQREDPIRRALVLMADHELNASTFATRVAVSTGASLAAGVLAGFATLSGPLHGGAPAQFARLLALATQAGAHDAIAQWLASGRPLPGFGHQLYPEGDPRARAMLNMLPELQRYADLAAEAEAQAGELPTVDFALPALAAACGLPDEAPFVLFALGRCVGWLAHALEQAQANRPIRPRARYVGAGLSEEPSRTT
ncbi:citrate synthase [Oxalobacteraceae bacterium OTU3CINTB1]|nr:citrate synthase [Oxalobacteraceae bacterium OTU3CINTB1]